MPKHTPQLLDSYRRKRSVDSTSEPFGKGLLDSYRGGPLRFVVHHHAARNTHYDLRLEMEGVLRSWAVPKGPSPSVKDKRFAALVEDHPLEYGDFEGKIPEGNYGAGWTIVWDRGVFKPRGDPVEGLVKGKIVFELQGQKLHGNWTLVRMKGGEKDWLFIKEIDEQMDESRGTQDYPMNSVFSGLSLEQLDAGFDPATSINRSLAKLKVPKQPVRSLKPMLAKVGYWQPRQCPCQYRQRIDCKLSRRQLPEISPHVQTYRGVHTTVHGKKYHRQKYGAEGFAF